ncbi:MAG: PEP-CTERM sorting domain-containing protein [Planctomycetota bacterium]|nr:PEP-CTERM sorting domain-containing protein [Planctomycetota bacterium]
MILKSWKCLAASLLLVVGIGQAANATLVFHEDFTARPVSVWKTNGGGGTMPGLPNNVTGGFGVGNMIVRSSAAAYNYQIVNDGGVNALKATSQQNVQVNQLGVPVSVPLGTNVLLLTAKVKMTSGVWSNLFFGYSSEDMNSGAMVDYGYMLSGAQLQQWNYSEGTNPGPTALSGGQLSSSTYRTIQLRLDASKAYMGVDGIPGSYNGQMPYKFFIDGVEVPIANTASTRYWGPGAYGAGFQNLKGVVFGNLNSSNGEHLVQSFRLDTYVPEPSSIALAAFGAVGVMGMVIRRRKA